MPTREPAFWVIPIIAGLISGGGSSAGYNYLWGDEPKKDLVLEYRVSQCEERGERLVREVEALETRVGKLPPPYWQDKIGDIEKHVRELNDAMIRLERHGHPEVQYEK